MNIDSDKIGKFLEQNPHSDNENDKSMEHISIGVMLDLAVNLWRLERAISFLEIDKGTPEMKRLLRHLNATKEDLINAGFAYEDLDGERVPASGDYALKTMEYIPKEDLEHDTVLETIKPNIFFHGELVQPGEVIVGIPKTEEDVIPMIEELLSVNVSREKCREIALESFSWDNIIRKFWKDYTEG